MKRMALGWTAVVLLAGNGCLQKDTTSTIYLRPDGSLDWSVSERNVRSDEGDLTERVAEESGYLDAIARDEHDVAKAFRALGGADVRTRVLRDARPYDVMIDARFASLSDLFGRALTACGVPHGVELTTHDGVTRWRLWAEVGEDGENAAAGESDACTLVMEGFSDWEGFSIRLESGRFVDALGFTLESPDSVRVDEAVTNADRLKQNQGLVTLSLSWTTGQPATPKEQ